MSNPSKAKGTRFETEIVEYLKSEGLKARRIALAGADDCGDIEVIAPNGIDHFIIEAKNVRETDLAGWTRQAGVEAANYAGAYDLLYDAFPLAVHKRRMKPVSEAYVTVPLHVMVRLMLNISTQKGY